MKCLSCSAVSPPCHEKQAHRAVQQLWAKCPATQTSLGGSNVNSNHFMSWRKTFSYSIFNIWLFPVICRPSCPPSFTLWVLMLRTSRLCVTAHVLWYIQFYPKNTKSLVCFLITNTEPHNCGGDSVVHEVWFFTKSAGLGYRLLVYF